MHRPENLSNLIQLSLPMAIAQLITIGSSFLCMMMLASLGHDVLAASAPIFSVSITILMAAGSILFSLGILIARRAGEKHYVSIGSLLHYGWLLSLIVSLPTLLIYWYIKPILHFIGQDVTVANLAESFFHANCWRVVPFFLSVCNQQLCYGVNRPRVDVIANLLGVTVLLFFSYVLLFGKLGFPMLGVAGAGYAFAVQSIFYLVTTTLCFRFLSDFKKFELFHFQIHANWRVLKELCKTGWPISLQISGELLAFLVMTIFIGWLGVNSLAAFQVIIQYQFLVVIPIFAIAQAGGILIGKAYTNNNVLAVRELGKSSMMITSIIGIMAGFVFILFPKTLSSLYLDVNDPDNAQTMHTTILLFIILAFFYFFDALRNVLTGTLRGLLDTRFPMVVGLGSIWCIGIPTGYILGIIFDFGAMGILFGMACGTAVSALILHYRWRRLTSVLHHPRTGSLYDAHP